jgi:acetolactate decarboxylase
LSADTTIPVPSTTGRVQLTSLIDNTIRSENLIYGIRVTGTFSTMRTRTVMEQRPPYPPLTQATAGQAKTALTDVTDTLAGFRTPDYEQESPSLATTSTS